MRISDKQKVLAGNTASKLDAVPYLTAITTCALVSSTPHPSMPAHLICPCLCRPLATPPPHSSATSSGSPHVLCAIPMRLFVPPMSTWNHCSHLRCPNAHQSCPTQLTCVSLVSSMPHLQPSSCCLLPMPHCPLFQCYSPVKSLKS